MKKFKNKKIVFIVFIIVIILLMLLLINNSENIQKIISSNIQKQEEGEELQTISLMVYDNKDIDIIKVLITINSDEGIEYAKFPNGQVIQANNNKQLAIDYEMEKDKELNFIVKETNKEEETHTIYIDNEYLNDTSIELATIKDELGYKIVELTNKREADGYTKTYYKFGTNGTWVEGSGKVPLLDYNIMADNLLNSDNTVTIYAKITNPTLSHDIIVSKNYNLDTSNANNTYTADSLIKAIEDYNFGSGVATVTVEDQIYNLRVYQFNESKNIEITTEFGKAEDVATASTYAQRMAVIKVNGDLTIEEGSKLTTYGNAYGGTKGLLIYCTGTLTNNGEVSMTARGAKAVGQNVYLWKNADESFEYVPAVGGTGGASISLSSGGSRKGNSGQNGTGRQTGGGASGGIWCDYYGYSVKVGTGSAGTSYSGGSASGGAKSYYTYDGDSSNAGANGGAGSNAGKDAGGISQRVGGGAGNPGGSGTAWGQNGTGGLLIIYANDFNNNSNITANGMKGGSTNIAGGSSGGGSINIFYNNEYTNNGTIQANGGASSYGSRAYGGAGGNGTVSIGNISTGTYVVNGT